MQCTSCHQLHPDENLLQSREATAAWADDQLAPNMRDNHACLQCHAEFSANDALAEHTHHAADSVGSECYNCHMPHTTYGLLKGIRKPHGLDAQRCGEQGLRASQCVQPVPS